MKYLNKDMKFINLLTIILMAFAVSAQPSEHLKRLKNAPIVESSVCNNKAMFVNSNCPFKNIDTVRYMHYNESPVHDFISVKRDIDITIAHTFAMAGKVAIEAVEDIDLVVIYTYLDGKGGTIAQAYLPDCTDGILQKLTFDNYDMSPGKDTPDSIRVLYTNPIHIPTIVRHEIKHILGFEHNGDPESIMNAVYSGPKGYTSTDLLGFELNFGESDFFVISKGDDYKITQNFNIKEFFSKCRGVEVHMITKQAILVTEKIRKHYNSPIKINSTYRHLTCNEAAGGATYSQHTKNTAVDWAFVDKKVHRQFIEDVKNNNFIVDIMRANGVGAIGLYNTHVHIDTREVKNLIIFDKTNSIVYGKSGKCGL